MIACNQYKSELRKLKNIKKRIESKDGFETYKGKIAPLKKQVEELEAELKDIEAIYKKRIEEAPPAEEWTPKANDYKELAEQISMENKSFLKKKPKKKPVPIAKPRLEATTEVPQKVEAEAKQPTQDLPKKETSPRLSPKPKQKTETEIYEQEIFEYIAEKWHEADPTKGVTPSKVGQQFQKLKEVGKIGNVDEYLQKVEALIEKGELNPTKPEVPYNPEVEEAWLKATEFTENANKPVDTESEQFKVEYEKIKESKKQSLTETKQGLEDVVLKKSKEIPKVKRLEGSDKVPTSPEKPIKKLSSEKEDVPFKTLEDLNNFPPESLDLTKKDINFIDDFFAQSHDLAQKGNDFVGAKMIMQAGEARRMKKAQFDRTFADLLRPYMEIDPKLLPKVNEVLIQGDIDSMIYNHAQLISKFNLSKAEISAYHAVRQAFSKAQELLVKKMKESGMEEVEINTFVRTHIGYVPHKWKNRYVIKSQQLQEDGSWRTISMDDFKTERFARKEFEKLKQTNKQNDTRFIIDTLDSLDTDFFQEQHFSFENLKTVIDNAKAPNDLKEGILDSIKDMVKEKGFGRYYIKRSAVQGYDKKQLPQTIAEYFSGFSGYITKMEYAPQYFKALQKVDPRRQKKFYRWMRDSIAYDLGNPDPKSMYQLKSLAYVYYLANDLSFLITNATQNFIVGTAELSKLGKGFTPEKELLRAWHDWATQKVTKAEKEGIDYYLAHGRLGGEMTAELMGFKDNILYRNISQAFNKAMFRSTAFVETHLNRIPAFLSARRLLKKQGVPEKELNAKALEVSDNIHFRYGRHHRARYERGVKGIAFVFTHYIRSLLWTLSRHATEKDFTAFTRMMAYTTLLGGASALPFYSAINYAYKEITGDEEDLHKKLPDPLKKGIPAKMGVDMSDRVSIELFNLNKIMDNPNTATKYLGALGGIFERGTKGINLLKQERYFEASTKLLPDMLSNVMRAYHGKKYGVQSISAKPLLDEDGTPIKYTTEEAIIRGMGFVPTREKEAYENRSLEYRNREKKEIKQAIYRGKIRRAITEGNIEKSEQLASEAKQDGWYSEKSNPVRDAIVNKWNLPKIASKRPNEVSDTEKKRVLNFFKKADKIEVKTFMQSYKKAGMYAVLLKESNKELWKSVYRKDSPKIERTHSSVRSSSQRDQYLALPKEKRVRHISELLKKGYSKDQIKKSLGQN